MRFCIYSWILLGTVVIEILCVKSSENIGVKLDQATRLGFEESEVWKSKRTERSPAPNWDILRTLWRDNFSSENIPSGPRDEWTRPWLGRPSGQQSTSPTQTPIAALPSTEEPLINSWFPRGFLIGCIVPQRTSGTIVRLDWCVLWCRPVPGSLVAIGSVLIYSCSEGLILRGNQFSRCYYDGWDGTPTCVKTCAALTSESLEISCTYQGARVSCESDIVPGTTASLACKNFYKIMTAEDPVYREITCLTEGVWDRPLFRCIPECGTSIARGTPLIVNGSTAEHGIFPWHVGIYDKELNQFPEQICGGTIISPGLVVSAGHCFFDDGRGILNNFSRYAVAAGKNNRSYDWPEKDVQKSDITEIILPARYAGPQRNYAEDIALVRLQQRFDLSASVRPICIDWDNRYERMQLQQGQVGKAVGWGNTASGIPSPILQELNLPFVNFHDCDLAVPQDFRPYLTNDKFCAGWLNGSSLCDGDSGGGLAFKKEGFWYLRGVVSVGPTNQGTCDPRYYTAFTNVGRFTEWIRDIYSQRE